MASRNSPDGQAPPRRAVAERLGRYLLYGAIASGGMATVYLGRLVGASGFKRTVAIKRLHPQYGKDPAFVAAFLDEARLAARIRHPNVVPTLDVVSAEGETFLVVEYVDGLSLARVIREVIERDEKVPLRIASAIMSGVLRGLHAAHEARDEKGERLHVIHRDVSPQNILLGRDGSPRLLDFGIAKALGRVQTTDDGRIKGKLGYMSPEQVLGSELTRRSDVFATGIVLWELVLRERLFVGDSQAAVVASVLGSPPPKVSERRADVPGALDALLVRALSFQAEDRFETAREMADALDAAVPPATTAEVSSWVERVAREAFVERSELVARAETDPTMRDALELATTAVDELAPRAEPAPMRRRVMYVAAALLVLVVARVAWSAWHAPAPRPSDTDGRQERRPDAASIEPPSAPVDPAASAAIAPGAGPSASSVTSAALAPAPAALSGRVRRPPPPSAGASASASSRPRSPLEDRE